MRTTNHSTAPVFPNGGWKCEKCNREFAYIFKRCGFCPRPGQEKETPMEERIHHCLRHAVSLAKEHHTTSMPQLRRLLVSEGYIDAVIDGMFRMWADHAAKRRT